MAQIGRVIGHGTTDFQPIAKQHSAEIYAWLQQGAIVYVCGDAARMAVDVDKALHTILEKEGGVSPEEAVAWMAAFKEAKRYRRDVY